MEHHQLPSIVRRVLRDWQERAVVHMASGLYSSGVVGRFVGLVVVVEVVALPVLVVLCARDRIRVTDRDGAFPGGSTESLEATGAAASTGENPEDSTTPASTLGTLDVGIPTEGATGTSAGDNVTVSFLPLPAPTTMGRPIRGGDGRCHHNSATVPTLANPIASAKAVKMLTM